jgi:hypothetical protein
MASSVSKDLVSLLTSYLLFCSFLSYFFCLITQVLHAFATEGAHCARVREVLNSSDVSNFPLQYKLQNPMKLETIFVIMTSDSPNRKWQTNAGLKKNIPFYVGMECLQRPEARPFPSIQCTIFCCWNCWAH